MIDEMGIGFTFVDLFAGIGGFRKAAADNGGKCLFFSEIYPDAIEAYCINSGEERSKNLGDITKIESLPSHDLLMAGVPCQSWSIAGKNLGFDDDRGQLWNDTLFLLNQSKPSAFIFENVKGLADPRNKAALSYIMERIKAAGYYADYYILNSLDYGVCQNRVRIYIIGFKDKKFHSKFKLPKARQQPINLASVLTDLEGRTASDYSVKASDLFGREVVVKQMSLSSSNGKNDYFLFNDIRNGFSTIHSWDIYETSERQKYICELLLKNRRKSTYGCLDGNPMGFVHFRALDPSITEKELEELVARGILKVINYAYRINPEKVDSLLDTEEKVLSYCKGDTFVVDELKLVKELRKNRISIAKTVESLVNKGVLTLSERRYDFKNTKISTGLFGVNRIFLPSSKVFPTLVASDTNDYVTTEWINGRTHSEHKKIFLEKVYRTGNYRRISKEEACLIQGFPRDYVLPESRGRWMKLIGNSVSVPVIDALIKAIKDTGVFMKKK